MTDQFRSELLKMRTTRTTAVLVLAAAALTLFGAAVEGLSRPAGELAHEDAQGSMFNAAGSTVVFMATLVGLIAVTSEFRYGTIRPTLIFEPRRHVVVAAKLAAAAAVGVVVGIVCVVVAFAAGLAILAARNVDVALTAPDAIALALGPIPASALGAMLGVAIGTLIRNQVGAIVALATYAIAVDTLIFSAVPEVGRYFPGKAGDGLTGRPLDDLLAPGLALAVLAAWTLAFTLTAIVRNDRTDA